MAHIVQPVLIKELKALGAEDIAACFNCGNCTAVCPLSNGTTAFPRRIIRYVQLGLEDRLRGSVEPWLCYYCGECSETCPRSANPGELMMAARRRLIGDYDWTGLARRFYLDLRWELAAVIALAAAVVVSFAVLGGPMTTELTPQGGVKLNTFAPAPVIEVLDWSMGGLLSVFLLINIGRMHQWIMRSEPGLRVPLRAYWQGLPLLLTHFLTQRQWLGCNSSPTQWWKTRWFKHLCVVAGYVTMFVLIVVFLRWFQTDAIHLVWHPQRWLGYLATLALCYGIFSAMRGRLHKKEELHKHSHASDWIFLVLLLLTTLSGILVHVFRVNGLPYATYYTYVAHLAILTPMLIVEVPFGKWSHLAYRPLALYFHHVKEQARTARAADALARPHPA